MLKYLMTHGQTPQRRSCCAKGRQRQACCRSRLPSFRPFVEALENRTLLSFLLPVDYATGKYPSSVAVGDFNGDGHLDLAVAINGRVSGGTVSVLLGNGDGTFRDPQDYAVGSMPFSVAVGD